MQTAARAETEIVLQNDFIEQYKNRATIDVQYVIDKAHPHPNPAVKDGDMHVAGRSDDVKLPIVAEIMNAAAVNNAVDLVHQEEGTRTQIPLSGAWRIWCEHGGNTRQVQGEHLDPFNTTNPPHVFEIHPITKLKGIDLLPTLHKIEGFTTKDAETAFQKYESLPSEITAGDTDTTIVTQMAGYNYVEFAARLKYGAKDMQEVEDGRLQMAEICNLEGEPLVRNLRIVFVKGSDPEVQTKNAQGKLVHLLGIPRIDLALVSWRTNEAKRPGGNKDVLKWALPYEIIAVGFYELTEDDESNASHGHEPTAPRSHTARGTPRDVAPNATRARAFESR